MLTKIIGDGTVGSALAKNLKIKALGKSKDPVSADVVIICVPTDDGHSEVEQALGRVISAKLVIIRSTILPGTTDGLQEKTNIPLMFVPEFGFEKTMVKDLKTPEFYLFGHTPVSGPAEIEELARKALPAGKKYVHMKAISAEFAKYFTNIWGCFQVVLANSLYDWVMEKTESPAVYGEALQGALNHKNIPKWGWQIFHNGGRGASGKCLPKDLRAAISDFPQEVWQVVEKYNNKLRKL